MHLCICFYISIHLFIEQIKHESFYCPCVPSTSRLIKTAGLTAAQLSGGGISTLTANWAVSRWASTGKCCLMISRGVALWIVVDTCRRRERQIRLMCFFLSIYLLRASSSSSTGTPTNDQLWFLMFVSCDFISLWLQWRWSSTRGRSGAQNHVPLNKFRDKEADKAEKYNRSNKEAF